MSNTLIYVAVLWLGSMSRNGGLGASAPIAYRIQALILTLYLIWGGVLDVRILVLGMFHPHWLLVHYGQPTIFCPAGISIAIAIAALLAGIVGLFIGLQVSQRKLPGFNWAVRCAPYLLVVGLLELTRILVTPKVPKHAMDEQDMASHDSLGRAIGTHVLQNQPVTAQTLHSPDAIAVAFVVVAAITIALYVWLCQFAKSPKNRQFIYADDTGASRPPG